MNWQLIKFIQKGFARAGKESYFLKFTRSVAFIGVMLGSIALILSLSILDGYEEKLYDSVEKLSAHIKISSFKNDLIPYSDEIIQNLKNNFPDITDISPIIKTEALIRSKEGVESIAIQANENFEKINKNNDITSKIVDGNKGFSSLTANEVIIGKKLAKKLNIRINEEIFIFTITDKTDNNFTLPDINKFKVIGIYETGMAQFDDINIYIPFKTVQSMIKIPDGYVSEYSIWLKSITNLNETTDKIQEFLGFPFFVTNIYQNFTSIFSWIELQKEPIPLVLGLITIVAVFNIITILFITIVEKTHSIGILRALGMKNKDIAFVFIFKGTLLGLSGTIIGCLIAFILSFIQKEFGIISLNADIYYFDRMPVSISFINYLVVVIVSGALSFLSTIIPSFSSFKIMPIKAIRFK